ncbi:MAG: polysaccharide deacetylase family protein [Rhizobiaceae bacterium]
MRLFRLLSGLAITVSVTAQTAHACGPDALGTSRAIKLDPAKVSAVVGLEKSLGLKRKEVILTFDDGPIAGRTSAVLKALEEECVKATFFYVGKMAKAYPRLVRKVVSKGHTLAHHTWSHERLPKYKIAMAAKAIDKGMATVETIAYGTYDGAPRVPFFRYPYLASNAAVRKLARKRGLIAFDANIDSQDWKKVSADTVHDRIMKRLKQDGRGIVLMHDIQNRTVKMLPRLLRSLKDEGYKIVHVVPATRGPKPVEPVVVASALQAAKPKSTRQPDPIVTAATRALEDAPKRRIVKRESEIVDFASAPLRVTAPPVPVNGSVAIGAEIASAREQQLQPRVRLLSPSVVALGDRPVKRIVLGDQSKGTVLDASRRRAKRVRIASLGKAWKLRRSNWIIR